MGKQVKLWLDDVRPRPDVSWVWAKSVEQAKQYFTFHGVSIASLDHDLGFVADPNSSADPRDPDEISLEDYYIAKSRPGADGIDLAIWMVEERMFPSELITIHSWNPAGAENMRCTLVAGGCPCPIVVEPFKVPADLLR